MSKFLPPPVSFPLYRTISQTIQNRSLRMPKAADGPCPTPRRASPRLLRLWLRPFDLAFAHERELLLVATLGLAALYYTALASFAPLDPSWLAVAVPAAQAENLAGTFGANLASAAVYSFGMVAWLLPTPFLTVVLLLVWRRPRALALSRHIGWILGLGGLCAIVAIRLPMIAWAGFDLPSGGWLGTSLADHLLRWFGRVGGWIALLTITLCSALMVSRRSLFAGSVRRLRDLMTNLRSSMVGSPNPDVAAEQHHHTPSLFAAQEAPAVTLPQASDEPWSREPAVMAKSGLFTGKVPAMSAPRAEATTAPNDSRSPKPRYAPPPLSVFNHADPHSAAQINPRDLELTAQLLIKTFDDFGVQGEVVGYQPGPVVTVFEFQPEAGVKQSKVVGLIDDLALALKVDSIFIHPVRGKRALGVQVPNTKRETVHLGDILNTASFKDAGSPLTFGMGKTINGQPMCADLASMPHLLMAGATGSGKSVGINALLCSIIMKAAPEDVRMILVDPKMLELSIYEGIPHLLMPVITEPTKASLALQWAAAEMERRYKLMQHASVRNISGFNEFWAKASTERRNQLREAVGDETESTDKLPYILLVIDELADLMMTAPKDVESSIQRLAQKARASGIHMVLATQRPSVDIITGVIKANLPCRIAFQVVSKHDSRTILDLIGAEKLLGKGDMLLQRPGIGRLERLQGALITDEEVLNLVATVKASSPVRYDDSIIAWIDDEFARKKDGSGKEDETQISMDDDPKWDEAVSIGQTHGVVSASFLQRHLKIGYNRAARIVEFMESRGLVDRADGAKPRKWLGHLPG